MRRAVLALVGTLALSVVFAATAGAHVTVNPVEAEKGGFAKLTFRVPNESDTASTVKLEIAFPEGQGFTARVKPVPGWTSDVVAADAGVKTITWSGGRIEPGQFQEFEISGGPLPDDVDSIEFKAVQTYDDGEVVRWIDPVTSGGEEPEHPAPTLQLIDVERASHKDAAPTTSDGSDDGTDPLAVAALAVAVVALLLGGASLLRGRSSS